jgi:hypothetical protein
VKHRDSCTSLSSRALLALVAGLTCLFLAAEPAQAGCRCDYDCVDPNGIGNCNGSLCVNNGLDCATAAATACAGACGGVRTTTCAIPWDPNATSVPQCTAQCTDKTPFFSLATDALTCVGDADAFCIAHGDLNKVSFIDLPNTVPTLSPWGIIVLAALLVFGGTVLVLRRRARSTAA